jgi:mono/diheme cytochrome c family protein
MMNGFRQVLLWSVAGIGIFSMASCALFQSKEVSTGRKLFSFYCAHCHGEKGQGNGFNAKNLDPTPRDLTDSVEPYMAEGTNEEIFNAIKNGVAGVVKNGTVSPGVPKESNNDEDDEGHGSPLMPYWGFTLSEDEIWSLVAYIRTLHPNDAEKIKLTENNPGSKKLHFEPVAKPDLSGIHGPERPKLIELGRQLYENKYACQSCHRIGESGGMVGPDLSRSGFRLNPDWIYRWIKYPQGILSHTKMPNFGIPDQDAIAITAYLSTLK